MWYMKWVEANRVPDWLIRLGIRANLESGLRRRYQAGLDEREAERQALLTRLEQSPIAIDADQANRQHYQVPAEFFQLVLGKRLKYSCCYWPPGVHTLDQAEDAMLQLTCERAQLEDGMDILDLGCGWGSFCQGVSEHYPNSHVVAVSNSRSQKEHIDALCHRQNIQTLRAWLAKLDHHQAAVRKVLAGVYGADKETLWLVNWRLFLMACEATWKLCQGSEYLVSHYLSDKR